MWSVGRRWGKTVLGMDRLIHPALKGKPVAWFSPTYKLLADSWRELRSRLAPVTQDKSEQEKRFELIGGGVIECGLSIHLTQPAAANTVPLRSMRLP